MWYELDEARRRLLLRKEAFYSKLLDEHISAEDYAHTQKVWVDDLRMPDPWLPTCTISPYNCAVLHPIVRAASSLYGFPPSSLYGFSPSAL